MQESPTDPPILIYDRIEGNRRKTRWLLVVLAITSAPVFLFFAHYLTGIVAMSMFMQLGSSPEAAIAPVIGVATTISVLLMGAAAQLFYRYSTEVVLRLTGARPVDPEEEPALVRTVENLCIGAGLPQPRLAIIESTAMNLYSTGLEPDKAAMVVTRGLLEALDRRELEGVVAQELTQIGNGDVRLGTVLATVVTFMLLPYILAIQVTKKMFRASPGCGFACVGFLLFFGVMMLGGIGAGLLMSSEEFPDPKIRLLWISVMCFPLYAFFLGPAIGYLLRFAVSRERELLADADAALLTRYPPGLARALVKIGVAGNAVIDAQPSIAHLWIADPRKPGSAPRMELFATHPPIGERIEALSRMGGTTPEMLAAAEADGHSYRDRIDLHDD